MYTDLEVVFVSRWCDHCSSRSPCFCVISKQLIVFWQRSCDQITVLIICKGNVVDDVLTSAVCSDCILLNCKSQVTLQMEKVWAVAYQECREKKYVMLELGVIM